MSCSVCSSSLSPRRQQHEKQCVNRLNWAFSTSQKNKVYRPWPSEKTSFYQPYMMSVQRQKGMTYTLPLCGISQNMSEMPWEPALLSCVLILQGIRFVHSSRLSPPVTNKAHRVKAIINRVETLKSIAESLLLQVFLQAIHHCGMAALRYARWAWLKPRIPPDMLWRKWEGREDSSPCSISLPTALFMCYLVHWFLLHVPSPLPEFYGRC